MMIPWYYRCPFTNWLMAKPWKWHLRNGYRAARAPQVAKGDGANGGKWVEVSPGLSPLRAAWFALTFPHVHHPSEDGDDEDTDWGR